MAENLPASERFNDWGQLHFLALGRRNVGRVDAADCVFWRKTDGTQSGYNTWRTNFGQSPGSGTGTAVSASAAVPEPTASFLLLSTVAGLSFLRRRAALSSQKVVRM